VKGFLTSNNKHFGQHEFYGLTCGCNKLEGFSCRNVGAMPAAERGSGTLADLHHTGPAKFKENRGFFQWSSGLEVFSQKI
jgi:hypothetical protein